MPNKIALKSLVGKSLACRNGLRHGAAAKTLFLPEENPEEFFAVLYKLFEFYRPSTEPEAALVTELAVARWFFLRRQSAYLSHKSALFAQKPDCTEWSAADRRHLTLLRSYKNESEHIIRRARGQLEPLRLQLPGGRGWRDLYELQKKCFQLERR